MKSGNLNFLEPTGPLQAALPLPLPFVFIYMDNAAFCHLIFLSHVSTAVVGLDLLYEVPCSHSFRHTTLGGTFWKNEELNDLYSSPNIVRVIKSRRMRWAGHVARMGEERGAYRVLVGKLEGKRPLGRTKRRWVDNIRIDLQEVGCGYVDWIGLTQDRHRWRTLVSAVMKLRVP